MLFSVCQFIFFELKSIKNLCTIRRYQLFDMNEWVWCFCVYAWPIATILKLKPKALYLCLYVYLSVKNIFLQPWRWGKWLRWLEHHPVHQRVAASIPGQSSYLGFRLSRLGAYGKEPIDVSLSLTPSSPSKVNRHILR